MLTIAMTTRMPRTSSRGSPAGKGGAWLVKVALAALVRSVLREPLVYFILLGALVFGVDAVMRRDAATIRITPSVRREIARTLEVRLGHAPQTNELDDELGRWKQEQALSREGMKMGLAADDPVVRSHVASKLLQIARDRDVFPEATDAELRDFFERHRSRFTVPATFDFDVVFVSESRSDARAQAERVLSELRGGASPEGCGDWFPRGTRYQGETLAEIAALFGPAAAAELPRYAAGEWNLVAGPRGFYAVRVTHADRGEPDFDTLRSAIAVALDAEKRDRAAADYAREVESRYRFVDSP